MGFPIPIWNDFKSGPQLGFDRLVFLGNRRCVTDRVAANVKNVFVVYACDDLRVHFRPSDLHVGRPTRNHVRGSIMLPGDHSDSGGRIENNRFMARVALREMIVKARSVDVPVSDWGLITVMEVKKAMISGQMEPHQGYVYRLRLYWYGSPDELTLPHCFVRACRGLLALGNTVPCDCCDATT